MGKRAVPTSNPERGIRDWAYKQQALIALDEESYSKFSDVVFAVLPGDGHFKRANQISDAATKWSESVPKKHRQFLSELRQQLALDEKATPGVIINCGIEEFISYLPEHRRAIAGKLVALLIERNTGKLPDWYTRDAVTQAARWETVLSAEQAKASVPVYFPRGRHLPTVKEGYERGRIDQTVYYLMPDAAHLWQEVVLSQSYNTYEHCRQGLAQLMATHEWRSRILTGKFEGVVMLGGGGAPTKDLVVINSLLNEAPFRNKVLHYLLVDTSSGMMHQSLQYVQARLSGLNKWSRVRIDLVARDVLAMDGIRPHLSGQAQYIWAITGGTIGNLPEAAFFRSLNEHSRPGDLLIVSADTFDNIDKPALKASLQKKYDNKAVFDLLSSPLAGIWSQLNPHMSFAEAISRLEVLVEDRDGEHSDVTGSISLEISLPIEGRRIVLLTSTRYQRDGLTNFAAEHGWAHVHTESSLLNPNFAQFLFQRT